MKKSTLVIIADIVNNVDRSNKELYEMIELLNITSDEMNKIVDAIMVTAEKIAQLKRANITDLNEYVDVAYIENTNRY
jgi:hypothetical protein